MPYVPLKTKTLATEAERPQMEMIEVTSIADLEEHCPANRWGIRQPTKEFARAHRVDPAEIDLVIVPGMGFTLSGLRIGRGAGFYDVYLKRLSPSAFKIGLSLTAQLLEDLPTDHLDVPLDTIVTPT